jgi:hypothetical protein
MTSELREASIAASQLKQHIESAMNVNTGTLDFAKLNESLKRGGVSIT